MVLATTGPRRVARHRGATNVGGMERMLSVVGGGALAAAALKRRGMSGVALGAVAAALLHRGATGRCMVYQRLGVSTADGSTRRRPHDLAGAAATVDARNSIKVEQSITIDAERPEVYDFWRDFDNHPHFMSHVRSVDMLVGGRTRYELALPGGTRIHWVSEIVKDYPGELISWKTVGDSDIPHAGSVQFRNTDDGLGTIVRVEIDYEPPGGRMGHTLSRLFGVAPEQMLRDDLRRLKDIFENS